MLLPSGPLEGALPLEHVLRTLYKNHVRIEKLSHEVTLLTRGNVIRETLLTETVPRWIIQWLARTFNIELTEFYEPPPGSLFEEGEDPLM